MQTISIIVSGKVQGVFFRKHTCSAALKWGLTGFVKNETDGNVYIEVTGTGEQLDEFLKWCHSGSPGSNVEEVTIRQLPHKKYTGFGIRY